jgi:hypothetical protein
MNTRAAAEQLGITPARVRKLIAQGKLRSTKIRQKVGASEKKVHDISEADLQAYQGGESAAESDESPGSGESSDAGGETEHPGKSGDSAADRVRQPEKSPAILLAAGALTLLLIVIGVWRPSSDPGTRPEEDPEEKDGRDRGGISLPGMP